MHVTAMVYAIIRVYAGDEHKCGLLPQLYRLIRSLLVITSVVNMTKRNICCSARISRIFHRL